MILLICGGRTFNDLQALNNAIIALPFVPTMIIEGGATGADTLAKLWAVENKIHFAEVPALWEAFGKRAGTLRNVAMTILKPDYCLAMPGGSGTAHMVKTCKGLKITTWEPYS